MERLPNVTPGQMNVQRCIGLHNAIVAAAVDSPNTAISRDAVTNDYFAYWNAQGESAEDLHDALTEPIQEFLRGCDVLDFHEQSFTILARGFPEPFEMYPVEAIPDADNFVLLYGCPDVENDRIGLVFDMDTNKASWIDDAFNPSPDNTQTVWAPLDVILEAWLREITRQRHLPGGFEIGFPGEPKGWHFSYPPPEDLQEILSAWDRYVKLVEDRIPAVQEIAAPREYSSVQHTGLRGMAASFLYAARMPHFKFVAPELVFPDDGQMTQLAERQRDRFVAAHNSFQDEDEGWRNVITSVIFSLGDDINAGLCLDDNRAWQDAAGLVLPSSDSYGRFSGEIDKHNIDAPYFEHVWQTNSIESPFWEHHYARLASIFNLWAKFVEDGTWKVNGTGIAGMLGDHLFEEEYTDIAGDVRTRLAGMLIDDVEA